ncbi:MAG: DUF4860 domain-containing protein [Clostridiales Family XIII bacterium]|jgi:hypothetical protein|nr:DUF4860 domain-containing protein [Clostridiales Family XIII bacterium]
MNKGTRSHSFNLVFTILLLGIFAMAAIFVAVLGAKIYANSAEKLQANFDTRTSIVYLSEKIRTSAGAGGVSVQELEGVGDALVLTEAVDGKTYESWIYVRDGELCESTVSAGATVLPAAGQRIMTLKSFSAEVVDGGVTLQVRTADGQTAWTFISGRVDG